MDKGHVVSLLGNFIGGAITREHTYDPGDNTVAGVKRHSDNTIQMPRIYVSCRKSYYRQHYVIDGPLAHDKVRQHETCYRKLARSLVSTAAKGLYACLVAATIALCMHLASNAEPEYKPE